jgi:1,4-alpha-glucan branching enzyme
MSIKKQYLKTKPVCKVTFSTNVIADTVFVSGSFNNWSLDQDAMKKNKSGEFTLTLDLEKDHEYQFRYYIDNSYWMSDTEADALVNNPFNEQNSILHL